MKPARARSSLKALHDFLKLMEAAQEIPTGSTKDLFVALAPLVFKGDCIEI